MQRISTAPLAKEEAEKWRTRNARRSSLMAYRISMYMYRSTVLICKTMGSYLHNHSCLDCRLRTQTFEAAAVLA